jgi:hypothetical protein
MAVMNIYYHIALELSNREKGCLLKKAMDGLESSGGGGEKISLTKTSKNCNRNVTNEI